MFLRLLFSRQNVEQLSQIYFIFFFLWIKFNNIDKKKKQTSFSAIRARGLWEIM